MKLPGLRVRGAEGTVDCGTRYRSDHEIAKVLTRACHGIWARWRLDAGDSLEDTMKKVWREPTLDEILNDPTLDTLLARDGVSKDELNQIIDEARETLARVPRSWQEGQEVFSSSISTEVPLLTFRMR